MYGSVGVRYRSPRSPSAPAQNVQDVRLYVLVAGSISLLGAWLPTRAPYRPLTVTAAITAMSGLSIWLFGTRSGLVVSWLRTAHLSGLAS